MFVMVCTEVSAGTASLVTNVRLAVALDAAHSEAKSVVERLWQPR